MGVGGKGKNFFSREKKPKRRLRYIFVSSLSTVALCEGGSSFSKKAAYFVKWKAAPVGDHLPVQGTELFKKAAYW